MPDARPWLWQELPSDVLVLLSFFYQIILFEVCSVFFSIFATVSDNVFP